MGTFGIDELLGVYYQDDYDYHDYPIIVITMIFSESQLHISPSVKSRPKTGQNYTARGPPYFYEAISL